MIKEIFDIEPIQKNSLLIFVCLIPISYLQLFLFDKEILSISTFHTIALSVALSVSWLILSLPSLFFFFKSMTSNIEDFEPAYDNIILMLGLFAIFWILTLTYVSYEIGLSIKNFIRVSISFTGLRIIFWWLLTLIAPDKKK